MDHTHNTTLAGTSWGHQICQEGGSWAVTITLLGCSVVEYQLIVVCCLLWMPSGPYNYITNLVQVRSYSIHSYLINLQLRFLIRWPSSTIRYFHGLLCIKRLSLMAISYDVIMTGNNSWTGFLLLTVRCLRLSASLSLIVPWYSTTDT